MNFKVTILKTNVIQYNEYYPYGLLTEKSWTRENSSNSFLYNGGAELNESSGWYETFFRGYDAALGRFNQVDPLVGALSSYSPYNYGLNNPVYFNDPLGDYADRFLPEHPLGGVIYTAIKDPFGSDPGVFGSAKSNSTKRVGSGSGNNWIDEYRSVEGNAMMMSSNTFNNFYGITDSNRADFESSIMSICFK